MKLTEQDIDLVDAYLAGELSAEALRLFEMRLAGDVEFADEVGVMEALSVGVKRSVLEDKMRVLQEFEIDSGQGAVDSGAVDSEQLAVDSGAVGGKGVAESRGKVFGLWKVLVVAASVGVIGLLGVWWAGEMEENSQIDALYAEYFNPPEIPIRISRSGDEAFKQNAYSAFRDERYDIAAPMLEQLWNESQDSTALYFAALAYWGNKDISKADQLFKIRNIEDSNYNLFIQHLNNNK